MINLGIHIYNMLAALKSKVMTLWLYVKFYVLKTKPVVNYLQLLDPLLFTGTYTYAFWKCKGIYKIEIVYKDSYTSLLGNTAKVLLLVDDISKKIEFRFYGIHQVITKTLAINADSVLLNMPTIQSDYFSQPASIHQQLSLTEPSEVLISSLSVNNQIDNVKMQTPSFRIEKLGATLTDTSFRVELPDFNTHINQ